MTYSGTVCADVRGDAAGHPLGRVQPGGGGGLLVRARGRASPASCSRILHRGPGGAAARPAAQRQRPGRARSRACSFTELGRRVYKQSVIEKLDPRGRKYYWIAGTPQWQNGERHRLRGDLHGRISVTPLHLDLTYYPGLESFGDLRDKLAGLDFAPIRPHRPMSDPITPPQRERMVRDLIAARGVKDERVLAAMRKVPRHLFVKDHLRSQAYGDHALPIGAAQTISQPYIVARMTELLEVGPEHSVLEIGTGSGYQTAILALLARRVYSLERIAELARRRSRACASSGSTTSRSRSSTARSAGASGRPYDRILVTAGAPKVPEPLLDQLAPGGVLLIPEGQINAQRLVVYRKSARGGVRRSEGEEVAFVPLLGRHGWKEGRRE